MGELVHGPKLHRLLQSFTQGTSSSQVVDPFILSLPFQGLQTISFVLILELYSIEYRTAAGCGFEIFWGLGVLWLALVAYVFPNWRHMQLAISLPSLLAICYTWWVMM